LKHLHIKRYGCENHNQKRVNTLITMPSYRNTGKENATTAQYKEGEKQNILRRLIQKSSCFILGTTK
jgi:hypothetical protein